MPIYGNNLRFIDDLIDLLIEKNTIVEKFSALIRGIGEIHEGKAQSSSTIRV